MKSPVPGCSTLMTSAPCSPSNPAQNGAAMRVPRSRTRTPSSGPLIGRSTRRAVPRSSWAGLLGLHRGHATLLAGRGPVEGGGRVGHELVDPEVLAPRVALAHAIKGAVDRRLDGGRRQRRDEGGLLGHARRLTPQLA